MTSSITRKAPALMTALAALVCAAPAPAGEFSVAQCDPANHGSADARFSRTGGAHYDLARRCGNPAQDSALKINDLTAAPSGAEGRIAWLAPAGLELVAVGGEARLRSDGGHRARLGYLDGAGEQAGRIATGRDEPGGFERFSSRLSGAGRAGFAAHLACVSSSGCPRSEQARAWVRKLRLTLRDRTAPTVAAAGSLLSEGWLRGARQLLLSLSDRGGGLRRLDVKVAGAAVAPSRSFPCALTADRRLARRMIPCPNEQALGATLETSTAPFHEGANRLSICARDFGSSPNQSCRVRTVLVDNVPPEALFRDAPASDPELIAVSLSDPHSGVASAVVEYRRLGGGAWNELETEPVAGGVGGRVDSRTPPPGRYLFRVTAVDGAGNRVVSSRRRDGGRMLLEFPLLERTRLSSRLATLGHRVSYGDRPRIKGRLRGESGAGIPGVPLELIERFDAGSRPRLRHRTVISGRRGRFSARLSAGPSRHVEVVFGGSDRYLPSAARPRKLAVEGMARLRLARHRVRAGGRVRFRGRVGARGARIPAPGKVVELQVREPGAARFRTVRRALHTGRLGRLRTSYRFGRFYRRPTTFRFRLRVTAEAGWPYRAPSHSRARGLTVIPR